MKSRMRYGWREERRHKRAIWSIVVFVIWLGGLVAAAFVIWRDDDEIIYP